MKKSLALVSAICACAALLAGCSKENKQVPNLPLLVSAVPLPDAALGTMGKGFACTGLAYDPQEDVFWMGNCGKTFPDDKAFHATIVKLTKDGKTNLEEIKLYELFPSMSDVQGITIDSIDNTIWFCSIAENKIRHISKSATDMGSIDLNRPTGIAYDSRTDTLWVLTDTELKSIRKDGTVIDSIHITIDGQDQLFLDEINDAVYFTAGSDYQSESYVYKVDLSTKEVNLIYTLKDSCAVEGIYIENETMYVLNDGYYHGGKDPVNQLSKYDIDRLMTEEEFIKINN